MSDPLAVEQTLSLGIDPSCDLPLIRCRCGTDGHKALSAWLARQSSTRGAEVNPLWNGDANVSTATRARLRSNGAAFILSGAEGGWPRGWWMLMATPAGLRHAAELADNGDRHVGPGGCGGDWNDELRCADCGAPELLTVSRALARIQAMSAGAERDQAIWASRFVCPEHGRCRVEMVRTDKCCSLCGSLLLRQTAVI